MKYLLSLFFLLFVVISVRAQKVRLTLNLTRGKTYYMVSSASSNISQIINTENNKINLATSFKIAFKVTDVSDSVYNMEASYQSLSLKVRTVNGNAEIDSKDSTNKAVQSEIAAAIINKPFSIIITKSGKVRSAENVENMINHVFNDFKQVDTAKKELIKSQFIQSFGGKALKEHLEIATSIFPDGLVKKNKKWTRTLKLESTITANLQTNYKLLEITSDSFLVHAESPVVTDNNAGESMINGLPVKYHLTGTMVSDIRADKTTGWVTELKSKQILKGDLEIIDNPKVPDGATIPITINNEQVTTDK
ncbi:MAG TPA: DUF6263 family protein [Mucilaginibacter sp.]